MLLRSTKRAVVLAALVIAALGSASCKAPCDGYFYCFRPCEHGAFDADSYEEARATCRAYVTSGYCGADADPNDCTCDCEN